MACATTRRTQSGVDIGAAERVSQLEALRIYTANGARAAFEEGREGLHRGGQAGRSGNARREPLEVDPWAIKDIVVERTILGGEIAIDRERDDG
jgi:predicted amidohydrolase YtcJ